MLRNCSWKSIVSLLLAAGVSRADIAPLRSDFEKDAIAKPPADWHLTTPAYHAEVTADGAREGRQCVKIRLNDGAAQERVAIMLRSVDARAYRGKNVRLRGSLRIEPTKPDDRVQLWLRVDRAGGQMGFFDNMDDRPVRDQKWGEFEITGDVAPDATDIVFGVLAFGDAPVWVDDIRLEEDGAVPTTVKEPARPLTGRGLDNLVAFTRLLGYVRHFHPSDEAASADWEATAIAGVREVEAAKDPEDLARRLERFFQPLAPTLRVFTTASAPPAPDSVKTTEKAKEVVAWNHLGFGHQSKQQFQIYSSQRERWKLSGGRRPDGAPDPADVFKADLGGGVSCLVPLALYAGDEGTLPHNSQTKPAANDSTKTRPAPMRYSGDDRATRLADVALAWNVLQHFYPYFDIAGTDWPAALRTALTAAAQDADSRAFLATLRQMVAALHDGHGGVYSPTAADPHGFPPVAWDWVEDRLVITRVGDGLKDIKPGAVVKSIDGQPAAEAFAAVERLISGATPQWRRYVALQRLGAGQAGSQVAFEIEEAGQPPRKVHLTRGPNRPEEPRPPKIHEVRKGILYVDVGRIDGNDFDKALPDLKRAAGIIFDFRGYPNKLQPNTIFAHIIEKPVTSAQWHVPRISRPDHERMTFERGGEWDIPPAAPYLSAKKAFITDGRAISYAESCMGIIEHYKLGAIVGGPTAGTNGNVNPFILPGGYTVMWTGMKVLKHDGSRHHGVGIIPTVPVSRTIAGVAAGKDEFLEKAIEVVSEDGAAR
jgi:C-terminal processing protease CtpA/Prc